MRNFVSGVYIKFICKSERAKVIQSPNKLNYLFKASDIERCSTGDTDCIKSRINSYVEMYRNGLRSLNLVELDPLHVDEIDIIQGSDSPVNVNLNFKNVSMFGLSKLKVHNVV